MAKADPAADCLFFIADLHGITTPYDEKSLAANTREIAAAYIASGLDIDKVVLFAQSSVPQHAQLNWLLGSVTPMGWLNRMTQFKDKAGKNRDNAPLGLYAYPVLQAADVLLYHGHACAGRRGPEAACRADARHRRRLQPTLRYGFLPFAGTDHPGRRRAHHVLARRDEER